MKKSLLLGIASCMLSACMLASCNSTPVCTEHVDNNNDGKCDNCSVVMPVQETVDITDSDVSLYEGKTFELSVTKTPSTATVTWTSSDASVATVSNGVITALKAGTATITATVGDGISDTVKVTVKPYSISIENKDTASMYVTQNLTLTVKTDPAGTAVWSSSNEEIATVKDGVVTGVSAGTVTIKADYNNVSDSIEITVKDSVINASVNAGDFDFSGIYQDDAVVKSNGSKNSFAAFNGEAGKYYVASATVKLTDPSNDDTWSRIGISHYNGTDSYYGLQLSPGQSFNARKTVTMIITNGDVQWGSVTDRSQVWGQHALADIDFNKVELTTVRYGSDFYSYINGQLYYVDNTLAGFDNIDTLPVLNLGSCSAEFSGMTVSYGEEAASQYLAKADKSMFYGSYADTLIGKDGSIQFTGAANSTCSINAKDHAAKYIGTSTVMAAGVESKMEFDLKIDYFGGRDAMPALAVTINRYDSAAWEARSLVIAQYKAGWTGWNSNGNLNDGIGSGGIEYRANNEIVRLEEGATYHVVFTRLMNEAGQDTKMLITDSNGNVLIEDAHGWRDGYSGRVVVSLLSRDLDCTITNVVISSNNA